MGEIIKNEEVLTVQSVELKNLSKTLSRFSQKGDFFLPIVVSRNRNLVFEVISNCDNFILIGVEGKMHLSDIEQFSEGANKEKCLGFVILD